jgi:uncharacterized membrane protein
MVALRDAKTIGAIGSILVLAGLIPNASILSLAGLILVIVGVKYIGDLTGDRSLYGKMVAFVILSIVGSLVGALVAFATLLSFGGSTVFNFFMLSLSSFISTGPSFSDFIAALLAGLAVTSVFFVSASIYLRRSYDSIVTSLRVDLFRTIGKLYLIGSALVIVFGLGLVILFVAWTLTIVAFISLPNEMPPRLPIDPWGRPLRPPPSTPGA